MTFYSGFSLTNDRRFFGPFVRESGYTVAGFSYGAIKAALHAANSMSRIDTLQLFSPAFFQTKKSSFKRLQLSSFSTDSEGYFLRFIEGCFAPYEVQDVEMKIGTVDELNELLNFVWNEDLMDKIIDKGIKIEVYLGLEDAIIDVSGAKEFFLPYATVTTVRRGNHFLQECK
ncbi:MAG: pimelyl-ACP methyl ester esterase BioV [Sulfuricurvum sp.]|nr:pimelyl-ACP methyl ester esterase BioV [Sulfuricurvum sp.]MDP3021612.1 pimelyl-ACP methyl ester esterase BioV [Sulfuricurvum sp.]MDP3119985.1 pimelyl-ACP methyl ester esterase BioV [Sulfuricurvum sp.]